MKLLGLTPKEIIQTLGWMTLLVVWQVIVVAVVATVIVVVLRLTAMIIISVDNPWYLWPRVTGLQVFSVIAAIIFAAWRRKRLLAKWSIDDEGQKQ
jgi:protein-S-isoprenylcysteine O-methyltransferase Ste14